MRAWSRCVAAPLIAAAAALTVPPDAIIRATEQPAQAAPNRDEILAAQIKNEKGGTADAGRPLFDQRCAMCHRFGEIGKDVGPDLTTITSRFKKADILDSILWPSKVISEQYQAEMFELKDGSMVSGIVVRETAAAVMVRTAGSPDKPVPVAKAQIANRTPATVSLMPEALVDDLSPTRIADLLAFLMAPPPAK
jgi:putative heme-binding domain-containing protein